MRTRSSQEGTLERVMAIPGLGAQVMAAVPIPDRARLRRTSRAFLAAVNESLQGVTELFGDDLSGRGGPPRASGLAWLLTKCPALRTLSAASRADHGRPWRERDPFSPTWPWFGHHRVPANIVSLDEIARWCAGLVDLNVAGSRDVTDPGLATIARSCPLLVALDLSSCWKVTDAGIRKVAEGCSGLHRLAVYECNDVSDASLVSLGQHCGQLEDLDAGMTEVTDAGVTALVWGCPRLRRLVLPKAVSDAGITQVAERCPLLERLGVWASDSVSDESIKLVAARCPRLEWLDLRSCIMVTDGSVTAVARCCPRMRRWELARTKVTHVGISAIASISSAGFLEHLDVLGCWGVNDASIARVARCSSQLRFLSMAGYLTGSSLSQVALNCSALRELAVAGCHISSAALEALAASCRDLVSLVMTGCTVGGNLEAVARGCRKLERFDATLTDCVTRTVAAALARHCTGLRVLKAGQTSLGDKEVAPLIAGRGGQLRVLDLSQSLITTRTIMAVARRCVHLQELYVSGCRITGESIILLSKRCKILRKLDPSGCGISSAARSTAERILTENCRAWSVT